MSARLVRVTLAGDELEGFPLPAPAASVRVLLAPAGSGELVMPGWTGNEFLLPDGSRPPIRTLTPWRFDRAARELAVGIVLHGRGLASEWARSAVPGAPAAVSGPGRGYTVDPDARSYLVAGDETAIPAITQVLEALPAAATAQVCVEVAEPAARLETLGGHPGAHVAWHVLAAGSAPGDGLVAAVRAADVEAGTRVWAAGEAAAVQRIRRHLLEERGVPREHTWIRGYWKHGRAGDEEP